MSTATVEDPKQTSRAPAAATPRPAGWVLGTMLLLPLAAHWFGVAKHVYSKVPEFAFARYDFIVLTISFVYAVIAGALLMRRSAAAKFVALVYSVLIVVIGGEMFLRFRHPGPEARLPWPPMRHVMEISTENLPDLESHVVFTVNKLGLRGPEVDLDHTDVKVLCVGGSTTECFYVTDEKSWPWLVQQELSKRLNKIVFVGNSGRSGLFSLHHEYLLRNYAPAKKFDHVVILAGANDMGALLLQDYEGRAARVAYDALTGDPDDLSSLPAPYYRKLSLARVALKVRAAYSLSRATQQATVTQDEYGNWIRQRRTERQEGLKKNARSDIPQGIEAALATYQANIRRIIDVCREHHQHVVFVTQPSLYRADLTDAEKSLLWQCSPKGTFLPQTLQMIQDRYNAALIDACKKERVDCIDLASMLPKDTTIFYDDFHFNLGGCRKVAAIVADQLAKSSGRGS